MENKRPGYNMINPALYHGNPAARRLDRSSGPCPHSYEAATAGSGGMVSGTSGYTPHHANKMRLEGVLNKYTNLLQGWQNRYFVLDPDLGQLQYFVNEQCKSQRPRGSLALIGSFVAPSEELPHMFTVHSATGEAYKLRASDSREQQLWVTQLQVFARRHSDSSAKDTSPQGRTRSSSLLPPPACRHPAPPAIVSSLTSSSPSTQRQPAPAGVGGVGAGPPTPIITFTHHRSPAAARRARLHGNQHQRLRRPNHADPGRLNEVKELITQAEGQQQNLVNSIESLPSRGPLSSLDQDLLLLKATSAATLSCLGECLNILQHNVSQAAQHVNLGRSDSPDRTQNPSPIHKQTSSQSNSNISSHNHNQNQFKKQMSLDANHVPWVPGTLDANHVPIGSSESFSGWQRPSTEKQVKNGGVTSPAQAPPPAVNKEVAISPEPPQQPHPSPERVDPGEETTDTEDNEEEDLGVREDQRSIILHLLSQLKLGMDLTRVVLPTFILEKRSLLEMYANFMAHPDMFLAITAGTTPEERIVRFVEYYLTAFHEGRKGAVAKKPYNPILGESFRCSWDVPRERVRPLRNMSSAPNSNATPTLNPIPTQSFTDSTRKSVGTEGKGRTEDCYRVRFVAEQVSHHPPVTGFYCECKERNICVNTHVWTRSKFMGMSIGVSMVGEGVLHLLEHGEDYVFTLPCAYARSILTVPWVELGGKVTISCAKSGYSATVTFHTKPFYGGKIHRVTAEVKHNPTGTIVCKAQGEWNGTLEFTYSSGETKVIDTSKLPVIRKKIRPMEKQGSYESRRLWQHVTSALKSGNIDSATEHKHRLEERQRADGRQRASSNTPWKPKFFIKEGEGWIYHNPLWKTH
ncbi:hypothetical protein UPYG_G00305010 [Umbra pygmaea]|uniref:Oxysterol-binding protein n=1 Tax=Umbra pygmaea TaxID=75934 RepID=A0ABD0WGH6_UMBPY